MRRYSCRGYTRPARLVYRFIRALENCPQNSEITVLLQQTLRLSYKLGSLILSVTIFGHSTGGPFRWWINRESTNGGEETSDLWHRQCSADSAGSAGSAGTASVCSLNAARFNVLLTPQFQPVIRRSHQIEEEDMGACLATLKTVGRQTESSVLGSPYKCSRESVYQTLSAEQLCANHRRVNVASIDQRTSIHNPK